MIVPPPETPGKKKSKNEKVIPWCVAFKKVGPKEKG